MTQQLDKLWPHAALAFRGYNTTNLGRTYELLATPAYESYVRGRLEQAGEVCAGLLGRRVDLIARVREAREAPLEEYAEAVALVFATELAQLDLLREVHGVDPTTADMSFGYSLGELVALANSGILQAEQAMGVPLAMATDCAALAENVTMGVLFSRELPINEVVVLQLCDEITEQGAGVIGVSAVLSPNTLLLLGQGDTIHQFRRRMGDVFENRVHLRLNDSSWPPLHTPIVWQKNIADRASVLIQSMHIANEPLRPPTLSLVTGKAVTPGAATRRLLRDWVDHPQRLWDAVAAVLRSSTQTVVHIGPAPNVIPATFSRLSENILQLKSRGNLAGLRARAMSRIVDRPWLSQRLPASAALLRAPQIKQVILEDWLMDNAPA